MDIIKSDGISAKLKEGLDNTRLQKKYNIHFPSSSSLVQFDGEKWLLREDVEVLLEVDGVAYVRTKEDPESCTVIFLRTGECHNQRQEVNGYKIKKIVICYPKGGISGAGHPLSVEIPASVTSIEHLVKSGCNYHVLFFVDGWRQKTFSSSDGSLYNKDMTVLLHYGNWKRTEYVAPSTLKYIAPNAFAGIKKLPQTIILPPCVEELDANVLPSINEIDFQGQLKDVVEGAFSGLGGNLTIKMNGLLAEMNQEGIKGLREWYDRNKGCKILLMAPGPEGGKYENGKITLTKVLTLRKKLDCGCDSLQVEIDVKNLTDDIKSTTLDDRYPYCLYSETEVTQIRVKDEPGKEPNRIILVHESVEEVIELIKKANSILNIKVPKIT